MQIFTSFIVNILALKMQPEKMNKKIPGACHRSPPAAIHLCGLGNYSFSTRCPSLYLSNVGKYALVEKCPHHSSNLYGQPKILADILNCLTSSPGYKAIPPGLYSLDATQERISQLLLCARVTVYSEQ